MTEAAMSHEMKYYNCNQSKDNILITSPFIETTRKGMHINSFITTMVLTDRDLIFQEVSKPHRMYSLKDVKLSIFKNKQRQCIKVCFNDTTEKYLELGVLPKRKIFWKLWCLHVAELNEAFKVWPYDNTAGEFNQSKHNLKMKRGRWTDKYLYLGSKRETEDCDRPKPIPGVGRMEDVQLFYLKPKYFGCWDQSEHWVQCGYSTSSANLS